MKVGSLFSGVGGFELAFKDIGIGTEFSIEIDKHCVTTLKANFTHDILHKDIREVTNLQEVDILTAGFPCQAFSIAGHQQGFNDPRGAIFFEIIRIAKICKPQVIFLENVKNLLSHNDKSSYLSIKRALYELGYGSVEAVMNTCEYSELPQNRERLYIVAFKHVIPRFFFRFPEPIKALSPISNMLEKDVDDDYYYHRYSFYSILEQECVKKNTLYQWRRKYVRENKKGLCPTLTANMGTGGHNVPLLVDEKGVRKLTPRECFNFQGFPQNFVLPKISDCHLYKQAGNSVSIPVIKRIAKKIIEALQQ